MSPLLASLGSCWGPVLWCPGRTESPRRRGAAPCPLGPPGLPGPWPLVSQPCLSRGLGEVSLFPVGTVGTVTLAVAVSRLPAPGSRAVEPVRLRSWLQNRPAGLPWRVASADGLPRVQRGGVGLGPVGGCGVVSGLVQSPGEAEGGPGPAGCWSVRMCGTVQEEGTGRNRGEQGDTCTPGSRCCPLFRGSPPGPKH